MNFNEKDYAWEWSIRLKNCFSSPLNFYCTSQKIFVLRAISYTVSFQNCFIHEVTHITFYSKILLYKICLTIYIYFYNPHSFFLPSCCLVLSQFFILPRHCTHVVWKLILFYTQIVLWLEMVNLLFQNDQQKI